MRLIDIELIIAWLENVAYECRDGECKRTLLWVAKMLQDEKRFPTK